MADAITPENLPARKPALTQARLKEVLHYEPKTGVFTWITNVICGKGRAIVKAGDIAGGVVVKRGASYLMIGVDGGRYLAHRLAFLYMEGEMPSLVDHEDTCGLNNSWGNIRPATTSQNNSNTRVSKNNKTGIKGVMRDKHGKKWVAQIKPNGKSTHLGTFETKEEASAAYAKAAKEIFGEFARTE